MNMNMDMDMDKDKDMDKDTDRLLNFLNCRNAGLSGIQSVRYRNEKKTNDAGTRTVPDLPECRCRNANAGVSFLIADKCSAALEDAS
jgi:hypothetical protein